MRCRYVVPMFRTHRVDTVSPDCISIRININIVVVVVDSYIQRFVLATEETTVTQQVSPRPIKCQSRLWSQRGTKVNGSHHGDNPLLRPTGIQIATKPLPGPTNREHRKLIGVERMSLFGYKLHFLLS